MGYEIYNEKEKRTYVIHTFDPFPHVVARRASWPEVERARTLQGAGSASMRRLEQRIHGDGAQKRGFQGLRRGDRESLFNGYSVPM